ncbi:MAG: divergent PAP2 family protein [Candidatus Marinimicrobia bacterium]|nr:divergent PAP2 family protein [Candidatus Neomarinimicrobiota bacterium]
METQLLWYQNVTFWSAFLAWFVAQFAKMLTHLVKTRQVDFRYWVSTGGMPSAHSAMATALATAVGLTSGTQSPLFAVAAAFAVVVMFDAQTVRHAAGLQARLLNQIVADLFVEHQLPHGKLKELLGHTPLEVFFGLIIGFLVAVIFYYNIGWVP